jgi:hypothetical protein
VFSGHETQRLVDTSKALNSRFVIHVNEANVNMSMHSIKSQAMKMYGRVKVKLYTFLTLVQDGNGRSASRSSCFIHTLNDEINLGMLHY